MWLTQSDNSWRISANSRSTTLFRLSQTARSSAWVEQELTPVAREFGQAMVANQQSPQVLVMPRIPGQARYLAALDEAVRQTVDGQISPADALLDVSAAWSEITNELGTKAQQEAYESSLGLSF